MPDSETLEKFLDLAALGELEDEDLVRLLMNGQTEAMAVLFDRYYALMMRIALRIVRNRAEAEDIVQVAFVDFYRQIKSFDGQKGSLQAWLMQYVYGRSFNQLKRLGRRRHFDHVELSEVPPFELTTPDEGVLDFNGPEASRLVEQALGALSGKRRKIVELVCFGGMTITEVAAATGEPHGRLQHRYYRAIEKLRAWMRKAEKERPKPAKEEPNCKKTGLTLQRTADIEVEIGKAQLF